MNRRSFLKILGAFSAASAFPCATYAFQNPLVKLPQGCLFIERWLDWPEMDDQRMPHPMFWFDDKSHSNPIYHPSSHVRRAMRRHKKLGSLEVKGVSPYPVTVQTPDGGEVTY